MALFGTYGRTAEKRRLEALLLDLVVRGRGALLVLRGDSGMGKTHLLEEIKVNPNPHPDPNPNPNPNPNPDPNPEPDPSPNPNPNPNPNNPQAQP